MEEELDDLGAVAVEMCFQVNDGTVPLLPEVFLVAQPFRQPFIAENFWMHPDDQHFLVVRAIEDSDPSAFRKTVCRAPEKIMLQLLGARLFETENLAAFGIDAGHDVPDSAVLAGRIYTLKNQQQ